MNPLRELFDRVLKDHFSQSVILKKLIFKKFAAAGIKLNEKSENQIIRQIEDKIEQGEVTFSLDDKIIYKLNPHLSPDILSNLDLNISDEDYESILNDMSEHIEKIMPGIIEETGKTVFKMLKRKRRDDLSYIRKNRTNFEARLQRFWRSPIDSLEMLIALAVEIGETSNTTGGAKAVLDNDVVFEVLMRLQARACRVASEVLTLIKAGFADGAHARWRTIHEIAIVSMFINEHGNDVAEKYLLHDSIEELKAARQYKKIHGASGYQPNSTAEIRAMERRAEKLKLKFGKEFGEAYGWAASTLKNPKPNFSQIEEHVGLQNWRSYYRMASHNVHAGPTGVLFSLGLVNNMDNTLLAGASDTGFADPAHGTALSLLQVTALLLLREPTVDSLVATEVLRKFDSEVSQRFIQTQQRYEKKYKTK